MPPRVHEVRIEQARRARHRQDEAVGLDNLMIDTMLIVAVAGIGRQVLERVMVVDKRHGIALETVIPDEAVILQQAEAVPALVIECLPDLFLQGEVKRGALETALVIHALDPVLDIPRSAPELADREGGPDLGVIVSEMLRLKATRIVIAEADVTQLVLEVAQVGQLLLLRGWVMVVNISRPRPFAGITAAVIVAAAQAALVVTADVDALAVLVPVPLDAVGLARCRTYDVDLIHKVGGKLIAAPCAQAALVVGDHVLHGACSCGLIGADEIDELGLGAEVTLWSPCRAIDLIGQTSAMVKVEHRHKTHAIRVVDGIAIMSAHPRAVVTGTPSLPLGNEHALV